MLGNLATNYYKPEIEHVSFGFLHQSISPLYYNIPHHPTPISRYVLYKRHWAHGEW